MSKLYRGHAIDASYQVSLHSANQKQELPLAAMFVNGSGQKLGRKHPWKVPYKDC
jgi:hypothetical protein